MTENITKSAANTDGSVNESVYAEQVKLLYKALPFSIMANIVAGILIVGIQWDVVAKENLMAWLAVFEFVILLRGFLFVKYSRPLQIENYHFWGNAFTVAAAVTGLMWGLAGIIMFPSGNELYQMTLIFCLLGMSAGAVSSHSFLKAPPLLFVSFTLSPLLVRFLLEGTSLGLLLAMVLVLCIVFLVLAAKRGTEATVNNIRLRVSAIEREKEVEKSRFDAEKANRAKSEFLSRMSHELRTPLNAILGFGQLLDMADLKEKDHNAAAEIVKAGNHLINLINEILEISRIESGAEKYAPEPVHVWSEVTEVFKLVQPLADKRNISLSLSGPENCNAIMFADIQRLRQVLLNLLSNAIKYNRDGGEITVTSAVNEDMVRIEVSDTGQGIDADKLTKVFDPFERLGAERGEVEGSGIGLSVCKTVIDAMGGTIGAESEIGAGSTFWIELPLFHGKLLTPATETVPKKNQHNSIQCTSPVTVLYIEDNPVNLLLMQKVLDGIENITLLTASEGLQGYELAVKHMPNLILLDLHLPDVPGNEILKKLRANTGTRQIPVVVVSADATSEQVEALKAAGAFSYLIKPYKISDLIKVIDAGISSNTSS